MTKGLIKKWHKYETHTKNVETVKATITDVVHK